MEYSSSSSSIESRVQKIKEMMLSPKFDPYSFVGPSAYDTAWLAMIPHSSSSSSEPMFMNCLKWVLTNQKDDGSWGDCDALGNPTLLSLPATLASIVALRTWNTGPLLIQRGLSFIEKNAKRLLKGVKDHCPRWFAFVLPSMVELAETVGLEVEFPESVRETVSYIFSCRENFLNKEKLEGEHYYPPLLSYLEALSPSCGVSEEDILSNLSGDGSLFQSPSATAKAFMATGNQHCLNYLQSLAQRCPNGVPQTYPMDEDLIKLCMINQLEKLGLAEYFVREIEQTLAQIYGNYTERGLWVKPYNMIATQLYKDSLAFQLLRMHGYKVSPDWVSWLLHNEETRCHIEKNHEYFTNTMINVYRASNLMFRGEFELEEVRSISRKLLQKVISEENRYQQPQHKLSPFHKMIEHELNLPWLARLDHLEHRMCIEENEANSLWVGKASHARISYHHNDELLQLARQNYEFRQSLYKDELEELKRWSEDMGLRSMGFGREKTAYCYYAVCASTSLPHDSYARMLVAKSAIIITVADDFFDMKASLSELEHLTDAIRRWDNRGLSSQCHKKIIFDALDNLVSEAAGRYLLQEKVDITNSLRDLWYETFASWLMEAKWSKNGHIPSIDDYLKIGMISISTHTLVLPGSCFLKPSLSSDKLRPPHYETVTKLLMAISRLSNDIQSYEKEKKEGKMNSVLIKLIEEPELDMEDSVAFVREIIDKKKKEFLEHVLMDEICDMPKPSKQFHLSCLKVFQMFFNSSNHFDSDTDMLEDINKAIYLPISKQLKKPLQVVAVHPGLNKKYTRIIKYSNFNRGYKLNRLPQNTLRNGIYGMAPKVVAGFIQTI